jgi:type IV pilus assembly protein PilW
VKRVTPSKYQRGFTLIEIMVALLLGVFLLGGIMHIFINSKKTYRTQEALSRLQENGRLAMTFLAQDIREAGYRGDCISNKIVVSSLLDDSKHFLYDFNSTLQGFDANAAAKNLSKAWTPTLDASILSPTKGSDIITFRKAEQTAFTVAAHTQTLVTRQLQLTTLGKSGSALTQAVADLKCAAAIVTDCNTAVVFHVQNTASNKVVYMSGKCKATMPVGNKALPDMANTYTGGQLYVMNTLSYYVRDNPNHNPALYRKTGTQDAAELVEGVEQMQILYGIDTDTPVDGAPNYYLSAADISASDWHNVVSVRINLLAVTLDNVTDKPISYSYNGTTITPPFGDRHLRRVFSSTFALRNHSS